MLLVTFPFVNRTMYVCSLVFILNLAIHFKIIIQLYF